MVKFEDALQKTIDLLESLEDMPHHVYASAVATAISVLHYSYSDEKTSNEVGDLVRDAREANKYKARH